MMMFIIAVYVNALSYSLVNSIVHLNIPYTSRDCFEEIHAPSVKLMISSYFPGNPQLFDIAVHYEVYPIFPHKKPICNIYCYTFKKIGGECETSLSISTAGDSFKMIKIFIYLDLQLISLDKRRIEMAMSLFPDYKPGLYTIVDTLEQFALDVLFHDSGKPLLISNNKQYIHKLPFLTTLGYNGGHICVLTENQHPVVLRPIYQDSQPAGYLSHAIVEYEDFEGFVRKVIYPAFECDTGDQYRVDSLVLIDDKLKPERISYKKHGFSFHVRYINYDIPVEHINSVPLTVEDLQVVDLHNLARISPDFNTLFLVKPITKIIYCSDESDRVIHISNDGTQYAAFEFRNDFIHHGMKLWHRISHSALSPCDN